MAEQREQVFAGQVVGRPLVFDEGVGSEVVEDAVDLLDGARLVLEADDQDVGPLGEPAEVAELNAVGSPGELERLLARGRGEGRSRWARSLA